MTRDDLRERLLFKNFKWTAPKYYDYPDGQDLLGKLSFTMKMGFFAGTTFGMFYALRISPVPVSYKGKIFKALSVLPGFLGAPFAFTTVTYGATNFRKKDDQWNYLLGSIAAAVTGATLAQAKKYTILFCVVFAPIAIAKKTAQMNGTILFPPSVRKLDPPYYQRTLNFSLTKNGEPAWTSVPPKE